MLQLKNVNAGYEKFQVLFDINVEVPKEKITALVGPNGSGKSTLLKTIMGITQIYSGEIFFNGTKITGLPPHAIARLGIAYMPQVRNVFENLTVMENLRMAGYIQEKEELNERIEEVIESFPVLKKYANKKAGMLSGGERQMLSMAMSLIRKPKVMLFDEPTASLAPKIASEVYSKIEELANNYKITIMVAEQATKRILKIAEQAILLISGKVSYYGSSSSLLNHPKLGKVFLGIASVDEKSI